MKTETRANSETWETCPVCGDGISPWNGNASKHSEFYGMTVCALCAKEVAQ